MRRLAIGNGHLEVVKLLAEHGADVNQAEKRGVSPLLLAAANGHTEVMAASSRRSPERVLRAIVGRTQ